jgi:hypothetical protein
MRVKIQFVKTPWLSQPSKLFRAVLLKEVKRQPSVSVLWRFTLIVRLVMWCDLSEELKRYLVTLLVVEIYGGNQRRREDGLLSLIAMIGMKGEAILAESSPCPSLIPGVQRWVRGNFDLSSRQPRCVGMRGSVTDEQTPRSAYVMSVKRLVNRPTSDRFDHLEAERDATCPLRFREMHNLDVIYW